jgi:cystathionine beta-lyase/cystathionine gamma-synthase
MTVDCDHAIIIMMVMIMMVMMMMMMMMMMITMMMMLTMMIIMSGIEDADDLIADLKEAMDSYDLIE